MRNLGMNYCISSLEKIQQRKNGCIHKAVDILLKKLPKRLPLTPEVIAAAILDPSVQHLDIVDFWLQKKKKLGQIFSEMCMRLSNQLE